MNYKELIENIIVPSDLPMDKQGEKYIELIKYVNSKLPLKLYRFRKCTERNLDSFYKDELWFSNGGEMNDDFDARIYYDKKQLDNWIKSHMNSNGNLEAVERIIEMDDIPEGMREIIPNAEYIFQILKTIPYDYINQMSHQIIQLLSNSLPKELEKITDVIQKGTKFACFTEKIYSDMMWGHYADNATGFAVEYKFGKESVLSFKTGNKDEYDIWCNLFPILYGNERLDATEYAKYQFQVRTLGQIALANGFQITRQWLDMVVPCPDTFMATKLAIKKSNDWRPEKEWRMFFITNDISLASQKYSYVIIKPSAVYLGRKISSINKKIITDMAKEKGIPIFKMDINESTKTYKLRKSSI